MKVGDTIVNKTTGQTLIVRDLSGESEPLQFEAVDPPGTPPSPMHVHPHQDERFLVLEGELTVEMNGRLHRIKPGEQILVPKGVPHAAWNAGSGPMRMLWDSLPALQTATFFEELYALNNPDVKSSPIARSYQLIKLMRDFEPEIHVTRPPRFVQSILFSLVSVVDRVLTPLAVARD